MTVPLTHEMQLVRMVNQKAMLGSGFTQTNISLRNVPIPDECDGCVDAVCFLKIHFCHSTKSKRSANSLRLPSQRLAARENTLEEAYKEASTRNKFLQETSRTCSSKNFKQAPSWCAKLPDPAEDNLNIVETLWSQLVQKILKRQACEDQMERDLRSQNHQDSLTMS